MSAKSAKVAIIRFLLAIASLLAIVTISLWPRMFAQRTRQAEQTALAVPATQSKFGNALAALLAETHAQAETDALILAELQTGAYTPAEPLLVENPYGASPLTALVAFTTETPAWVRVQVQGKTSDANIDHDFPALQTQHLIPVYGLYAGYGNTVTLTVTDSMGQVSQTSLQIKTEAIAPETYGNMIVQTDYADASVLGEGLNFLYSHKLAFDAYGDIRWFNDSWAPLATTLYQYGEGTYITAYGAYHEGDLLLLERNLLGKLLRVWYSPYGVHHDIAEAENGNLLVTGSKGSAIEDFVYELDASTGEVVHTLDLKTILPRSSERANAGEKARLATGHDWNAMVKDWFHLNAIVYDGGDLILSGRHNSAVVKIAWPSGQIKWILASPFGWQPMYQKYLLAPEAEQEGFEWPYWQHSPTLLPDQDNDPATLDILLFDNGTVRFGEAQVQAYLRTGNVGLIQNYTRMVQYRINEKDKSIRQIWQYGKERGEGLFSERCGSVQALPNGNRFGLFLIELHDPKNESSYTVLSEVNEAGHLVWEALLTGENGQMRSYRAVRLPLYRAADQNLHIGQNTSILVPTAVFEANGVELQP